MSENHCKETNKKGLLYQHDICLLSDTWKRDESKIGLPGWWDFSLVRPKHKKSREAFGWNLCPMWRNFASWN